MFFRDGNREDAVGAADVAQGLVVGEVEFFGKHFTVGELEALHGVQEGFEHGRVAVKRFKDGSAGVFDFVLRLAGAEPFGQVAPEAVEPRVAHFKEAADVTGLIAVEVEIGGFGVAVLGRVPATVLFEKADSHQCVKEVHRAAGVKSEGLAQLGFCLGAFGQFGEDAEFDCAQQGLRGTEAHADLHDVGKIRLLRHNSTPSRKSCRAGETANGI